MEEVPMGNGKMEIRFFISIVILVGLMMCVFIFDLFPGDHVAKGITLAVLTFVIEGGWAIIEVKNLIKQGKEEDAEAAAKDSAEKEASPEGAKS